MGHCREESTLSLHGPHVHSVRITTGIATMFATTIHWGHKGNRADHLTVHDLGRQAPGLFLGRAAQIGGCDVGYLLESEDSGLENHRVRRGPRFRKNTRMRTAATSGETCENAPVGEGPDADP
jgi:hypothetical protein